MELHCLVDRDKKRRLDAIRSVGEPVQRATFVYVLTVEASAMRDAETKLQRGKVPYYKEMKS